VHLVAARVFHRLKQLPSSGGTYAVLVVDVRNRVLVSEICNS
jgi:hypothetical protein